MCDIPLVIQRKTFQFSILNFQFTIMDKERVKNFLKNYLPMEFVSEEDKRAMYKAAINHDYLHYEGDLSEGERKRQREEFEGLLDEMIAQYAEKEFNRQLSLFTEHYDSPIVSPQLHWNEKFLTPELENYTPIIAINDLVNYQYVVCAISNEKVEFMLMQLSRTPIVIAQYDSLEEMVRDGWRMGS